jgi:hypothetical protein
VDAAFGQTYASLTLLAGSDMYSLTFASSGEVLPPKNLTALSRSELQSPWSEPPISTQAWGISRSERAPKAKEGGGEARATRGSLLGAICKAVVMGGRWEELGGERESGCLATCSSSRGHEQGSHEDAEHLHRGGAGHGAD